MKNSISVTVTARKYLHNLIPDVTRDVRLRQDWDDRLIVEH